MHRDRTGLAHPRPSLAALLLPLLFLPAACGAPPTGDLPANFSFEESALPAPWQPAETHAAGTPARWAVQADAAAPGGRQVLRLVETRNAGETYNLLLHPGPWPADLELDVRLRADSGREDQGGGLVWRVQDAANYYLTRWNPLEHNLRIFKVVNGQRTALQSVDLVADVQHWHELAVSARGERMYVRFDGLPLLEVQDGALRGGGAIGVWTKADAATSFDLLQVRPAPAE